MWIKTLNSASLRVPEITSCPIRNLKTLQIFLQRVLCENLKLKWCKKTSTSRLLVLRLLFTFSSPSASSFRSTPRSGSQFLSSRMKSSFIERSSNCITQLTLDTIYLPSKVRLLTMNQICEVHMRRLPHKRFLLTPGALFSAKVYIRAT